jgi:hypothetical protein
MFIDWADISNWGTVRSLAGRTFDPGRREGLVDGSRPETDGRE